MLHSQVKWRNLLLGFAMIMLLGLIIPAKDCYASGLSLTRITNSGSSTQLNLTNDPSQNTDIPLSGYFTPTFSNSVFNILDGYAGKPYVIDNTTKVKLERIVNEGTTPAAITFGDTNTAMVINYTNLVPGSQYILTLAGDATNPDQSVSKGITANNNNNSLSADIVIAFTTVAPAAPAAPTITGAALVADTLILSGLPSNAANLEYCLAVDGSNYGADWRDLTVTNQTAVINEEGLIPGTSKVEVRVKADPDLNTPAGASAEVTVTGTVLPPPQAPSLQSALLAGTTITLSGLPSGATNLEYSISEDGTGFTTWQNLSLTSSATQAAIDSSGYTLASGVSKIGVRVKADISGTPAGDVAAITVVLALNAETPLVQGKTYVFAGGITIYAHTLNPGDNTVTVRDAKNQIVDYMHVLEPGNDDLASVYGVFLKGPGDAGSKKVVITLPIPANIPKDKYNVCGVYDGVNMKYPNQTNPETNEFGYWAYVNKTDRSEMDNNLFKVTCDNFSAEGSDYMYSVLYDITTAPSNTDITNEGYVKTADGRMAQKIWGQFIDNSGISEMDVYRDGVLYDIVGDKTSYHGMTDRTGDFFYYDYNVQPGEFHSYKVMSYSVYGRSGPFSREISVVAMSDQDIVNQTKAYIEDGTLQFSYAPGDSADSVSQGFTTFTNTNSVNPNWVTSNPELGFPAYTCDRPDILEFGTDYCNVYKPLDADEAVVHVTARMHYRDENGTEAEVTAALPPITVKWTEETVIGSVMSIAPDDAARQMAQLSAAANRPDVKTIIINKSFNLTNDVDFHGKTVKAGPYFDAEERDNPNTEGLPLFYCQSPSCSIENAIIDADGKRLQSVIHNVASPIIDNVQFTGMDRTKYALTASGKCTPTVRNCSFSATEQAGIFSYFWQEGYLPNITVQNCTFDGEGKPGYAILVQSGQAEISNCVIEGYQGELVTGWNSSNDTVYDYDPYKGLHDGFSSAGIFIRDDGNAVLHGNSISACDSGIKIWTGGEFKYYKPVYDGPTFIGLELVGPDTVYTTVNGTEIKDAGTAGVAAAGLKQDNTATNTTYGLDICSAADPDNPLPLYQGTTDGGQTGSELTSLNLSGSPQLVYNGTNLNYDLSQLTLSALNENNGPYDLSGSTVVWQVNSGPATINGNTLIITGSGRVEITAAVDSVTSNVLSLTISDSTSSPVTGKYIMSSLSDNTTYSSGRTGDGILTMTVNEGISGLKFFGVNITPVTAHAGKEAVVFVQLRNGAQLSMNVTKADFDMVDTAQAGFNVQPGDIVKAYLVDDISNGTDFNPTILE